MGSYVESRRLIKENCVRFTICLFVSHPLTKRYRPEIWYQHPTSPYLNTIFLFFQKVTLSKKCLITFILCISLQLPYFFYLAEYNFESLPTPWTYRVELNSEFLRPWGLPLPSPANSPIMDSWLVKQFYLSFSQWELIYNFMKIFVFTGCFKSRLIPVSGFISSWQIYPDMPHEWNILLTF